MLKNSNLLPDPGMDKHHSTTFENQLIELDSVDSTNNYAMARIHEGMAFDGLVCLARHQWAGKGQRGKSWQDEPGQNLMMSMVVEPGSLVLSQQFLFSAAVVLGIRDLVMAYAPGQWFVKWPNDVFWNDRKAAGVLIESVIKGQDWLFAVAGVGINLNQEQFPSHLRHAVSLRQINSSDYDAVLVAKELIPVIQNRISNLRKDPDNILEDYNRVLYKLNQPIVLRIKQELIVVTLLGVDESGLLLTSHGNFAWGETEWVFEQAS